MGKVGKLKMRKMEKEGECTSVNWHLINLTRSQVERKQGKCAYVRAHTHTHTQEEGVSEQEN